ncbi:hypothetical protein ACOMHN_044930 [Nucella lapillus]
MKFWQRFLILGSACFLMGTVYYYSALDGAVTLNLQEHRRALKTRLEASSLHKILGSFSWKTDPEVCSMMPAEAGGKGKAKGWSPHPFSNVSTVDVFHEAHFNVLADGMYELPSAHTEFPSSKTASGRSRLESSSSTSEDLETLNVILMPHSHVDPGWQKTTSEYYTDQTKHILTNMVNKLTEHPDLTFVWAETIYFAMWWHELEDAVKVHVRRLIRRGQLEVALGGWVMPDEASTHYVAVVDQLLEGHQWLWENLGVKPRNSWSIDPFGYSGTMPYLWKLAGMDNMVIQRVHQAVKASLMSRHSLEFFWRQYWDREGATDILCHVMPYMLYSIKFTCGPNRFICMLYDFRSIPGEFTTTQAQSVTEGNVKQLSEHLYKQFRQKAFFYQFNTILVPLGDDFRYDRELEWDQQYGNYSRLMKYMNARSDWKIKVRFGTLQDYFQLTRRQQLTKKFVGRTPSADFPVLSGDFFPYSDRNLEYWTGYYTTRPFDKRFQREVQSMIQAADIAVTLTYALYKKWGREVKEKFFHLASLMQSAHRCQGQFLHHDAITGTSRNFVVVDYETRLLAGYSATQSVTRMALQALVTKSKMETPYVFHPETVRPTYNESPEKEHLSIPEGGLRVYVFNALPQYRQQPVRVLLDTNLFYIKNHQRDIVPCQINPVWERRAEGGVEVRSNLYEVVFVADLPPLATIPFVFFKDSSLHQTSYPSRLAVFNAATLVVPPETYFPYEQPQVKQTRPVSIQNENVRIKVDPQTGRLMEMEDMVTGNVTVLDMALHVYRSQGSGAYLFRPKSGSEPLITDVPFIRVVEGPLVSELTVVFLPYITQTFTLYHHPEMLTSGVHIRNDLNIRTLEEREVILRMKTDLRLKEAHFFSDQNGMQFIQRRTNENTAVEANYYPMTSEAFLDDGQRRVSLLSAQPHGVASLEPGWLEVMLDRHLLYDDNRGMEEGVIDIKPVTSDFILLLETRPEPRSQGTPHTSSHSQGDPHTDRHSQSDPHTDCHSQGDHNTPPHYAFPSLLSLALADRLQQQPYVYYSSVSSDILFSSFQPMKTSLPCDLAMLSLRSLSTGNLNYNGTSLILHRRAYDCDFPPGRLLCTLAQPPPTFEEVFRGMGMGVVSVRETSLTHLHHKRSLDPKDRLELKPMEIASYHLTF